MATQMISGCIPYPYLLLRNRLFSVNLSDDAWFGRFRRSVQGLHALSLTMLAISHPLATPAGRFVRSPDFSLIDTGGPTLTEGDGLVL